MKRSRSIRLVLIGGLSAGAATSCGPDDRQSAAAAGSVYTNNYYVAGRGYYHAPFRNWYALPYNHYDSQQQRYFHGGQWTPAPHQSITNLSEPMAPPSHRLPVSRSGFGSTAHRHYIHS